MHGAVIYLDHENGLFETLNPENALHSYQLVSGVLDEGAATTVVEISALERTTRSVDEAEADTTAYRSKTGREQVDGNIVGSIREDRQQGTSEQETFMRIVGAERSVLKMSMNRVSAFVVRYGCYLSGNIDGRPSLTTD